jgi:hypothetical protein
MATVNFRYPQTDKDELKAEAEKLGFDSLSDYIISIIENRPKNKSTKKKLAPVVNGKEAKTRVNFSEKKLLMERAVEEGETESFIILRQIRIYLTQEPYFSKEEVKALRLATTQVTAIGRNLNQIVTLINSGQITDSKLSQSYMEQLKQYIDDQAKSIRTLINRTKNRVIDNG